LKRKEVSKAAAVQAIAKAAVPTAPNTPEIYLKEARSDL